MNVIDFLEYLADAESTRELAHQLADAWAEQQVAHVFAPAA
jgi:hypothetical protein